MDRESPAVIEAEIAATRQSLAAKLDAAEHKTVGVIREAVTNLEGDVSSVGSVVTDTVGAVREQAIAGLQDALYSFDPRPCIQRNPLTSVGAAVLSGFVTGLFAFRGHHPRHVTAAAPGTDTRDAPTYQGFSAHGGGGHGGMISRWLGLSSSPIGGFLDQITNNLENELRRAGEEVAGTVTSVLSQQISTLKSNVTRGVKEGASHLTENLTEKVSSLIPSVGGDKGNGAAPQATGRPVGMTGSTGCYAG